MIRILAILALMLTAIASRAESPPEAAELAQYRELLAQRRDLDVKRAAYDRIAKEVARNDQGLPTMVQPRELYPAQTAVNQAQDKLKQLRARLGQTRPNLLQWQLQQMAKLIAQREAARRLGKRDPAIERDIALGQQIIDEEAPPPVEWRRHASDPLAPHFAGEGGEFRYR